MKKKLLPIAFSIFLLFVFVLSGAFAWLYWQLSRETRERMGRGAIESIIFSESPVYYDDGESVLGVFFEKIHRRYIRYPSIPPQFIKALVAAEDKNFFSHPGFDLRAMVRAMIANVRLGRIAQGGSTLTQQTAKNVFTREKRSYKAKAKELMQALLLEREYSKEEILEMYANQFFVAGMGRGLRIAAQYFFDKEAEALDLVECAFIAGSVKSPSRFNPFTKKTEAERNEAERLARLRKDYVLEKMLALRFITLDDYEGARKKPVPFKQGKTAYTLTVLLDFIREQLESEYFREILQEQGIENIATSGIKIYTSINKEMQEGALGSIRKNLPVLEVMLRGYGGEGARSRYRTVAEEGVGRSRSDLPFLCRITEVRRDRENPYVMVAWDDGGGLIDYEGLRPVADAWLKSRLGRWAVLDKRHMPDFLKTLSVGDLVPVQSYREAGGTRLFLSEIPELEGGVVVLSKGMVKAMVGGFFDRFFNRASDAKRQLGSIFKPLVYTAALQLNWNTLDPLVNMPDLFSYQKTSYIPKANHEPESDELSMAWAGIKSENLATVWLLYHLTDQLNMSEFRRLMELLDLDRKAHESYEAYVTRIRDGYGVLVDREALMEAAFEEAKKEVESDLVFSGQERAITALRRLHFHIPEETLDPRVPEELRISRLSFSRLQALHGDLKKKLKLIRERSEGDAAMSEPDREALVRKALESFYLERDNGGRPLILFTDEPRNDLIPLSLDRHIAFLTGWEEPDIWVDGVIPSGALDLLQESAIKHFERLNGLKRYDGEVLAKIGDFRRLVNTLYLVRLSKELGIDTKLDPVLSFPLGANAVTILEAARAYEAMITGKVHPLASGLSNSMTPVISKIVDREGNTLWQYEPVPKRVLSERVCILVADILRQVMENGTGRSARNAVRLSLDMDDMAVDIPLPTFGKTGTANRFTNSSFIGFLPGPEKPSGRLALDEGYVIATYVGFDDNRPMRGSQISIYGASGALPLWIDTANAVANSPRFKVDLNLAELAFGPELLHDPKMQAWLRVPVSPRSGLPIAEGPGAMSGAFPALLADAALQDHRLLLKRAFEPIRGSHGE